MSKIQNPIIGRASGQAGGMVFSKYFDQNIMKSKPMTVKASNTPKQANQRALLKAVSGICRDAMQTMPIVKRSARTGRNTGKTARAALSGAIFAQASGSTPHRILNAGGISLQGEGMASTVVSLASFTVATSLLVINWNMVLQFGQAYTDVLSVVLVNLTTGRVLQVPVTETRNDEELSENIGSGFALSSHKVAVFVMFDSADGLTFDAVTSKAVTIIG